LAVSIHGTDARYVVEIHVAAGAQGVEGLLQPGGAALAEWSDDDVGGARPVRLDRSREVFRRSQTALDLFQLGDAARAARRDGVHHMPPDRARRHARQARSTAMLRRRGD